MPTDRVVECPHCKARRTTRAARGTVLRCECGKHYRAPAIPAGDPPPATPEGSTPAPGAPLPAAPVPVSTAPATPGVTVRRANATKVGQKARPRAAKSTVGNETPAGAPAAPAAATPPAPPGQARAKAKGRLGGLRGLGARRYDKVLGRG